MKLKNEIRIIVSFLLVTIVLLVTSCVDGFKESEVFSSSVRNTTLQSPDSIVFTPSTASDTLVTLSWPVVNGAGGYQVSFYKVDDPANPVVVGTENQVVDGISTTRLKLADTKYKAVVKTLGNKTYNNKDAVTATVGSYSTLVPANAIIPTGTDLYAYFTANPITASTKDQVYELEIGGSYTMTGDIPTGLANVTIRGNKVTHPTITMSSGVFISDGGGFNLSTINLDCSNFTGKGILTFNPVFNPAAPTTVSPTSAAPAYLSGWAGMMVASPVTFRSCKVTGLISPLIFDNGVKYALQTCIISDCIIGQNTLTKSMIAMTGGIIKDLTLTKSTFYNTQVATAGYTIQYVSTTTTVLKIIGSGWATSSQSIKNCTFWQMNTQSRFATMAGMSQAYNTMTAQNDIFVDTGNQRIIKDLCINATMKHNIGVNSYWFSGAFATPEITSGYDAGDTDIKTDPALKDPANGDFTVQGAGQISAKCGDPRWLP